MNLNSCLTTEIETVDGVTERVSVASLKRLAGQSELWEEKAKKLLPSEEAEAAMEKSHHLMQAMLAKAEERAKPYKEIDMLLASRQMEPQDFQQLRQEAKEAEDNLEFLTEEADGFYGEIQSSSKPHNKKRRAMHQNTPGRDAGVEQSALLTFADMPCQSVYHKSKSISMSILSSFN